MYSTFIKVNIFFSTLQKLKLLTQNKLLAKKRRNFTVGIQGFLRVYGVGGVRGAFLSHLFNKNFNYY